MTPAALMYHDLIGPDGSRGGFEGPGAAVYAVSEAEFERQMDGIAERVGESPLLADPADPSGPGAGWMLTFDDGGVSAVAAGAILARRGWSAHFFIVTERVGRPGFLDWDQVRELAAQGHAIGSHSRTHPPRIGECSPEQLRDEWGGSVAVLGEALGAPVKTASVPGGYYSKQVGEAAAAAGISALFTSEPTRSVDNIDGCALIGRYAVRGSTPTARVLAAAAGSPGAWLEQRSGWLARRFVKRLAGSRYERLRAALLRRR